MDLIPIDSSSIRGIGYDDVQQSLYVQFVEGPIYEYLDVPEGDFIALMCAKSAGAFINRRIKPCYEFRKLRP